MSNDNQEVTVADIIVESMPFADQLIAWCNKYPDFKEALKVTNPNNFIALLAVSITYTDNAPGDEIIGFFAYDMTEKFFKQDYIVNEGGNYQKFKLYSKLPNKNYGEHVQHINDFFKGKYGKNGHYANTHHYTLERLSAEQPKLAERAKQAIALAERIEKNGRRELSQAELVDMLAKVRQAKTPVA